MSINSSKCFSDMRTFSSHPVIHSDSPKKKSHMCLKQISNEDDQLKIIKREPHSNYTDYVTTIIILGRN